MKHYNDKEWIDFARGALERKQWDEMQRHLEHGCPDCKQTAQLWAWMSKFGLQEPLNGPPESAVRIVKAAIGAVPKKRRGIVRQLAELVFDSYSQPQIAGVRSTAAGPRQLLYRAGPLMIDMRLERTDDTERFTLMGQVLTSGEKKVALRQVPVQLLSGVEELASTATNQFGEFFLEHQTKKDLQVSLGVSSEKDVFISLDESIWRVAHGQ